MNKIECSCIELCKQIASWQKMHFTKSTLIHAILFVQTIWLHPLHAYHPSALHPLFLQPSCWWQITLVQTEAKCTFIIKISWLWSPLSLGSASGSGSTSDSMTGLGSSMSVCFLLVFFSLQPSLPAFSSSFHPSGPFFLLFKFLSLPFFLSLLLSFFFSFSSV